MDQFQALGHGFTLIGDFGVHNVVHLDHQLLQPPRQPLQEGPLGLHKATIREHRRRDLRGVDHLKGHVHLRLVHLAHVRNALRDALLGIRIVHELLRIVYCQVQSTPDGSVHRQFAAVGQGANEIPLPTKERLVDSAPSQGTSDGTVLTGTGRALAIMLVLLTQSQGTRLSVGAQPSSGSDGWITTL